MYAGEEEAAAPHEHDGQFPQMLLTTSSLAENGEALPAFLFSNLTLYSHWSRFLTATSLGENVTCLLSKFSLSHRGGGQRTEELGILGSGLVILFSFWRSGENL